MADFVAVLKKTLDGLGETTPAIRERVYEKARSTIAAKLAALNPPPPAGVAERQMRALEDAIATIESDYAPAAQPIDDPLAELENVFASLKNPQPRMLGQPAPPKAEAWPQAPAPAAAAPESDSSAPAYRDDAVAIADEEPASFPSRYGKEAPARRRSYVPLLAAAFGLAVLIGGGYGVWLNKDAFVSRFGSDAPVSVQVASQEPAQPEPEPEAEPEPEPEVVAAAPVAEQPEPAPEPAGSGKFTQRLSPDGEETDPGPAGGEPSIGEGTSMAALTQPPTGNGAASGDQATAGAENPSTEAAAEDAAIPVGQRAIFYEERTSSAEGSAEPGTIVWSLIQESPGGDLPPEPAIRAEATIPGKDLQLRMTIKRNADQTLPASHIIEMIFLTPDDFEGGGIDNILRVAMKGSEQEAGNPLIGIPAKIADGFFLVALNDTPAEIDANLALLRRQSWIDVPIVYKSGRRALFTMEKGIPGDKVFDEALQAWRLASAG